MLISEFFKKTSHNIIFSGYSLIAEFGWINLCIDNNSIYEYMDYSLIFPGVF